MQIIIAVVIQNTATLFQYTQPFPVCLFRMLQIPCEISRNDHIKGFIFKRQLLGISLNKLRCYTGRSRVLLCLIKHSVRIIKCGHPLTKHHCKKTRSASKIQHFGIVRLWKIFVQQRLPVSPLFLCILHFFHNRLGITIRTGIPIRSDCLKLFHMSSLHSVFRQKVKRKAFPFQIMKTRNASYIL